MSSSEAAAEPARARTPSRRQHLLSGLLGGGALAAGTLASVLYFSPNWFEQWAEKSLLVDLNPWLRRLRFEKEGVFWDARAMEQRGETFALPYDLGATVPVHKKTAYGPLYLDGVVPTLKTELDMLETRTDQVPRGRPVFREYIPWYAALTGALAQGFGGEISPQEMFTRAILEADAAIRKGVS